MSQNMELDAGDLVSRLRALVFTSPVMKGWPDWRPKADAAMTEAADFISRLSTAPAGDVVALRVAREVIADMVRHGHISTETGTSAYYVGENVLPTIMGHTAPTPSPQTSPATEGEAVAWRTDIFESLPNGKLTRLILEASEVKNPDPDWTPLYRSPPPAKAGEGETLSRAIAAALHSLRLAETEVPLLGPKAEAVAVNNVGYFIAKAIEALSRTP